MDLFPDGGFVRLRSRGNGKYVHADGDWEVVSLRPLGDAVSSLESLWRVEHWFVNQVASSLQLQNVAYGRCLSFSQLPAHRGHRGNLVNQVDGDLPAIDVPDAYMWRWRVERVHANQGFVRLRYTDEYNLRANGRHRWWNAGVSADYNRRRHGLSTMMQWTVHQIAATAVPLPLPDAPPPHDQPQQIQRGLRRLLFWRRRPGVGQQPVRTIRYVRANDDGVFVQNHYNWALLHSTDNSVFNLRMELGKLQNEWNGDNASDFTLCMRPGTHGRLIPLVTDLPRSDATVNIVIFMTGSPAAAALRYPQIDAAAQ